MFIFCLFAIICFSCGILLVGCNNTHPPRPTHTYTINFALLEKEGGTLQVGEELASGTGQIQRTAPEGKTVECTAIPDQNCQFYGWTIDGTKYISKQSKITINATENQTYYAVFCLPAVITYERYDIVNEGSSIKYVKDESATRAIPTLTHTKELLLPEVGSKFGFWAKSQYSAPSSYDYQYSLEITEKQMTVCEMSTLIGQTLQFATYKNYTDTFSKFYDSSTDSPKLSYAVWYGAHSLSNLTNYTLTYHNVYGNERTLANNGSILKTIELDNAKDWWLIKYDIVFYGRKDTMRLIKRSQEHFIYGNNNFKLSVGDSTITVNM